MKVSHNWLRAYVQHTLRPDEAADRLTMAGLEVEGVEPLGTTLDGVVVGEVRATRPHPDADRLTLCDVDLGDAGDDDGPVQIVCGAPNVAAGQKVPVATVGTTLRLPSRQNPTVREPVTIRAAKLRGERSSGMICAEDELGLSDDHAGIMVLADDAPVGQAFHDYLAARGVEGQDFVLDVSITPNRPDATSHLGMARDLAALEDLPLLRPEIDLPRAGGEAAALVDVRIDAPESCPRYVALVVRGVTVGPSPVWLKRRLEAVGLRPRNNVVDVTNFVMFECGQPLHAFDLAQLAGSGSAGAQIVVRETEREEPFTTLDGKERRLPAGTLLIADAERAVAVAGVMGGENSEVTDATTDVLIESAYFDPSSIRRTAKALGLQTDASYRFERGVDREGQVWAAARAAALIAEIGGGEVVPGMVDAHPVAPTPRTIRLRYDRIAGLLGTEIPIDEVIRLLRTIGFHVTREDPLEVIAEQALEGRGLDVDVDDDGVTLRCVVPSFRPDVEREVDVIEEVARLWGYDRIPEPPRTSVPNVVAKDMPGDALRRSARGFLSGIGYREVYTNSMLPEALAERFASLALVDAAGVATTLNPISKAMATLRPSLLPGALGVIGHNQNHGQAALRVAEFGHVYHRTDGPGTVVPGYAEHEALLLAVSGTAREGGWEAGAREADFYDLKGDVEALLARLGVRDVTMTPEPGDDLISYRLVLEAGGVVIGRLARLNDAAVASLGRTGGLADWGDRLAGLRPPLFFAELHWERLAALAAPRLTRRYAPISRFPTSDRDLAVALSRAQPVGPVLDAIRHAAGPLLRTVRVFDLYEGDRLPADRKSVAFALRFGADRTLTDDEVEERVRSVVDRLRAEFGAELRG